MGCITGLLLTGMRTGLVLGKFMPLHKGHIALADFALKHCDKLNILVCANNDIEPIPGALRLKWAKEVFHKDPRIEVHYTEEKIPYTNYSSRYISGLWGQYIKQRFPDVSVFVSSEEYGDYVAEYLGITHVLFDKSRLNVPVSASLIRQNSMDFWDYMPRAVQPYFVKKICICGTESTGKSTLTERLARHFVTTYVQEMARVIPKKSEEFTPDDLFIVADLQAKEIMAKTETANKVLFSDTGLLATKVYAQYLFGLNPVFESWIKEINHFDLYLFLTNDVLYVQDGTRLPFSKREELHQLQLNYLRQHNVNFKIIDGNWDERFAKAVSIIEELFF